MGGGIIKREEKRRKKIKDIKEGKQKQLFKNKIKKKNEKM